MHRVAVIIVNHRTPELVVDCLESLVPGVGPATDVIVVVDNASGDGSSAAIRKAIAERGWDYVRLVESPVNGGFSAGNNVAIQAVRARAYFLLNSDTLVRPGAIASLWETLQSDTEIGLASPRLEWPDGRPQTSCFRLHTPWSELIQGSATGPIRRLLASRDVPIPITDRPFQPEWTSFAAVMIRSEVFEDVGLLDDRFFMYYEDCDFCRRVRQAGWKIQYNPTAQVVHLRGGTSPVKAVSAARKRRPRYYYESRSRFFVHAYGRMGLLAANCMWTLGRTIAWLREHLGRKEPHTVEKELRDIWKN